MRHCLDRLCKLLRDSLEAGTTEESFRERKSGREYQTSEVMDIAPSVFKLIERRRVRSSKSKKRSPRRSKCL